MSSKGGSGVGSASFVLIFAVLCMTIFALISLSSAVSDRVLSDTQEGLVTDYYDADMRAEFILAKILSTDAIPETIDGVSITVTYDPDTGAETAAFSCQLSDAKVLDVEVIIYENSYEILQWKMRDTRSWETDDSLPVWIGEEDDFF